jgi:hypothetical protein
MEPERFPRLEITVNGVTRYKTVGWHQLLTLLDQSIVVEQLRQANVRTLKLPQLPERVLFVNTTESPQRFDITVTGWVPGLEYPFLYQERSFLVRVPTMVYQIEWNANDKVVQSLRLAVTTDDTVTAESRLYRWPFSNVYGHSQRVCWTEHVQCDLHEVVEKAVFGFLQTPNNRDLFGVGSSHNSPYRDYEEFLQAVVDNGGVPVEWLIPLGKTVAEFHAK